MTLAGVTGVNDAKSKVEKLGMVEGNEIHACPRIGSADDAPRETVTHSKNKCEIGRVSRLKMDDNRVWWALGVGARLKIRVELGRLYVIHGGPTGSGADHAGVRCATTF